MIKWVSRRKEGAPKIGKRVLAYSEIYKDKDGLEYRILDSQFVKLCNEVTHYAYLTPPKKEK